MVRSYQVDGFKLLRSAVDQVAEEHSPMARVPPRACGVAVSEGSQESLELVRVAVHVADHVVAGHLLLHRVDPPCRCASRSLQVPFPWFR